VIKRIVGGSEHNPLADYRIPYQERQPNRSVRQELESAFLEKNWVLILGKSGLGKTREAAHLANLLNQEGWTVLKLKDQAGAWLDVPKAFPSDLNPDDKLLFFLDDLNRCMYAGNPHELHPTAGEDLARPLREPLQERLPRLLQYFEHQGKSPYVRVIATARNEREPDKPGEPSPWDKLQIEKYPSFWQQFYCYPLEEPSTEAIVSLLTDCVASAGLNGAPEEYGQIAQRNDGTFRNITLNLDSAQNRGLAVNNQVFSPRLDQTWRQRYNKVVQRYPLAKHAYDAVELLLTLNLWLTPPMLFAITQLLLPGRGLHRWWQSWQLRPVIAYLIETEQILTPKDGQIEAKKTPTVEVERYVPAILRFLDLMPNLYPNYPVANEFLECGNALSDLNLREYALISFERSLQIDPESHPPVWSLRGLLLMQLDEYEEALFSFDEALRLKPNYPAAWYDRGNILFKLELYEEAIASFEQVIKFKPDYQENWNNWGASLGNLGRHQEAFEIFEKVVKDNPDDFEALFNLGCAMASLEQYAEALETFERVIKLNPDFYLAYQQKSMILLQLERYEESLSAFEKVVKANPSDPDAWNNLGAMLGRLNRFDDALASYDNVLKIEHDYPNAWLNRGFTLFQLGRTEEAFIAYGKALKASPSNPEVFYSKACCYALMSNIDLALEQLQRALELDSEYGEIAKTDSDFDGIRDDERFQALVNSQDP